MLTENGIGLDLAAVREVFEKADLITIGFATFPERLLIDPRTLPDEGPLVAIVAPVASVQERYLWLGKHRGNFPAPQGFSFFVWPNSVRWLMESGALEPLRARLAAVSNESDAALDNAIERLALCEQEAVHEAITGAEGWVTVWQSPHSRHPG